MSRQITPSFLNHPYLNHFTVVFSITGYPMTEEDLLQYALTWYNTILSSKRSLDFKASMLIVVNGILISLLPTIIDVEEYTFALPLVFAIASIILSFIIIQQPESTWVPDFPAVEVSADRDPKMKSVKLDLYIRLKQLGQENAAILVSNQKYFRWSLLAFVGAVAFVIGVETRMMGLFSFFPK